LARSARDEALTAQSALTPGGNDIDGLVRITPKEALADPVTRMTFR